MTSRSLSCSRPRRGPILAAVLCAPLAAQQLEYKPAPLPDPIKGMHDMSPMGPDELARRTQWRPSPRFTGAVAQQIPLQRHDLFTDVLFDDLADGQLWVHGATYKASFSADGFVYVPDFGSAAPKNYPVHFVLRAARVGGREVPFAAVVPPLRNGNRIVFDRGMVREIYDVAVDQVEQTFVLDVGAGDVEVDVEVRSDLREDAERAGLQFGNELGLVHYGTAFLVDGQSKREITTTMTANTLTLRVANSQRGQGPVVIDPIIYTSMFTQATNRDCHNPDIAYDASTDRYMLVWERLFSQSDTDVFSEFRNGDGTAVPGSLAAIDMTSSLDSKHPRVANLNLHDLFLVVMQRYEGNQWQVWGRQRYALALPQPSIFRISDPSLGPALFPDIGGNSSATAPAGDHWLVAWQRLYSTSDFDIHARMVRADASLRPTMLIENSAQTIYSTVHVSQGNGGGFTTTPRWLVVYQFRFSATDEDIYGAVVDQDGMITRTNTGIVTSTANDLFPSVSSPMTHDPSNPLYMVTYERQSPLQARAHVLDSRLNDRILPTDLGQFGLGPFWLRAESDGCRFAVLSGSTTISVATLALAVNGLVLHEAPQALVGTPSFPRIASRRSAGGIRTDYGIVFVDEAPNPNVIRVAMYRGHTSHPDFTRRTMACGGLGIDVAGRAMLGENIRFWLSYVGTDATGFLLGQPATPFNLCPGCAVGVNLNGPLLVLGGLNQLDLTVPCTTNLLARTLAVQAFAAGSGTCFGTLRLSDTINFTIG